MSLFMSFVKGPTTNISNNMEPLPALTNTLYIIASNKIVWRAHEFPNENTVHRATFALVHCRVNLHNQMRQTRVNWCSRMLWCEVVESVCWGGRCAKMDAHWRNRFVNWVLLLLHRTCAHCRTRARVWYTYLFCRNHILCWIVSTFEYAY